MSELFVVATPIGNLSDITFRAIETLKAVDFIAAEDTRQTKKLLDKYDIDTRAVSFHAQTSETKTNQIIERITKGQSCALVSDAGTPGISDPGFRLTTAAYAQGIKVIPIPGASAVTTLISAAGFPTDKFTFHGFLPHKKGRQTLIKSFIEANKPQIVYESVHRFPKLLKELETVVGGERSICVGRELTKMFEEIWRGTVSEAQAHFDKNNTKGEFVVIIAPKNFKS